MAKGAVKLGAVAALASHIAVACSRCERKGRYHLTRLVAHYGPDFPMTDLGSELANCPRRTAASPHERCDVYFPGLAKIMSGDA